MVPTTPSLGSAAHGATDPRAGPGPARRGPGPRML